MKNYWNMQKSIQIIQNILKDIIETIPFSDDEVTNVIMNYKNTYNFQGLFDNIFPDNSKLRFRFNKLITDQYDDDNFSEDFMQMIRIKILKNEMDIYETTYPLDYIQIIIKYIDNELTELGY
jgi:hypothetical protein